MLKFMKFGIPSAVFALGILTCVTPTHASPKIVKETGIKNCKTCHTQGKELNDAGKCYKDKKDLGACKIAAPK